MAAESDAEIGIIIERVRTLLQASVASGDIVAREEINAELDRLENAIGDEVVARTRIETVRDNARLALELQDADSPAEGAEVDTGPAGEPAAFDRALAELNALERDVRRG